MAGRVLLKIVYLLVRRILSLAVVISRKISQGLSRSTWARD